MTQDESLDMSPFERSGRVHIGEDEGGKSGNDGEAVDHRSAEWDGGAYGSQKKSSLRRR